MIGIIASIASAFVSTHLQAADRIAGPVAADVVEVIDVEEALSYRIDGHGHDMLHWCLPGVPDWLIAVMFRFVLVDE